MSAYTPDYRPQIGQTLFMAFMHEAPYLVEVTGYHHDPRFSNEQIEFTISASGKSNSSSIDFYRFYPDAAVDSKFTYCVVQTSDDGRETLEVEEAYFFDPQTAFDFKAGLESGAIKSRLPLHPVDRSFRVQVEQI